MLVRPFPFCVCTSWLNWRCPRARVALAGPCWCALQVMFGGIVATAAGIIPVARHDVLMLGEHFGLVTQPSCLDAQRVQSMCHADACLVHGLVLMHAQCKPGACLVLLHVWCTSEKMFSPAAEAALRADKMCMDSQARRRRPPPRLPCPCPSRTPAHRQRRSHRSRRQQRGWQSISTAQRCRRRLWLPCSRCCSRC